MCYLKTPFCSKSANLNPNIRGISQLSEPWTSGAEGQVSWATLALPPDSLSALLLGRLTPHMAAPGHPHLLASAGLRAESSGPGDGKRRTSGSCPTSHCSRTGNVVSSRSRKTAVPSHSRAAPRPGGLCDLVSFGRSHHMMGSLHQTPCPCPFMSQEADGPLVHCFPKNAAQSCTV